MATFAPAPLFDSPVVPNPPSLTKTFTNIKPIVSSTDIVTLGAEASETVTKYSDEVLEQVKTTDLPVFESHVVGILTTAKGIQLPTGEKGGFLSSIKNKLMLSREQLISKFTNLKDQIDKVVVELDKLADNITNKNIMLDKLYQHNMEEHDALTNYIEYGESVLKEKQNELDNLKNSVSDSNDMLLAQQINDLQGFIARLEKRVDSLRRMQIIAIQTAPFIRLIQNNNLLLLEKFSDLKTLTLPTWRKQVMLYVSLEDQKKGVAVANAIDDATNQMMKQAAAMLEQNTIDTYRASQRSVVDMDTLQTVQNSLINTLTNISSITKEGQESRNKAKIEMEQMKQKYLEMATA